MNLYISNNSICELPLVYMKMAKVYNSMGSERLAEASIYKAISISDSCKIDEYVLLSKRTLFDIYKSNFNFPKALAQLEEINVMVEKLEKKQQRVLMRETEIKYNTLLAKNENINLKIQF